jgi:hypothetical protein
VEMVDYNRALLDELMGRNRDLDPQSRQNQKVSWTDPEVSFSCKFYKCRINKKFSRLFDFYGFFLVFLTVLPILHR